MNVRLFMLCDAATVREGLINMLGGGVREFGRPSFPAPLGVSAAVFLDGSYDELVGKHRLGVQIQTLEGADANRVLAEVGLEFTGIELVTEKSGEATLPVVFPLQAVAVPAEGTYAAVLVLDDQELTRQVFKAQLLENQQPSA